MAEHPASRARFAPIRLLQSFQGLLLRFQTARDLLPTRPAEAEKTLESAIDQAAQAITEGREAVQGLRASTVERNDLAQAITTFGQEARGRSQQASRSWSDWHGSGYRRHTADSALDRA